MIRQKGHLNLYQDDSVLLSASFIVKKKIEHISFSLLYQVHQGSHQSFTFIKLPPSKVNTQGHSNKYTEEEGFHRLFFSHASE